MRRSPPRHVLGGQAGFSLIEVILITTILAVAALIAIPKLIGVTQTAEDRSVQATQESIESSITILHSWFIITGQTYDAQGVIDNIDTAGVQMTVQNL